MAQDVVNSAKRLVTGKDLARDAVTGPKVKNNSLTGADVEDGGLLAKDLAPGTIPAPGTPFDGFTKAESDARYEPAGDYQPAGSYQPAGNYLSADGKAVDADKLDGLDAGAFLPSQRFGANVTIQEGNSTALFTVPGALTVTGECMSGDPPTSRIRFDYLSAWDLMFSQNGTSNPSRTAGVPGASLDPAGPSQFTGTPGVNQRVVAKLARQNFAQMVELEIHGSPIGNFQCIFAGYGAPLNG